MFKVSRKIVLALCLLGSAFAAQAAPDVALGTPVGPSGSIVNLPITFTNDGNVVGFQADITYDPAELTPGAKIDGADLGTGVAFSSTPNATTVRVVVADFTGSPTITAGNRPLSTGELVLIPFTILGADGSVANVALSNVIFSNGAAAEVGTTGNTDGTVTAQAFLRCDANNSGSLPPTIADVFVAFAALGSDFSTNPAADCNNSGGNISIADVFAIFGML